MLEFQKIPQSYNISFTGWNHSRNFDPKQTLFKLHLIKYGIFSSLSFSGIEVGCIMLQTENEVLR